MQHLFIYSIFFKQSKPVIPVVDTTCDMAVAAARGSKVVRQFRESEERKKVRPSSLYSTITPTFSMLYLLILLQIKCTHLLVFIFTIAIPSPRVVSSTQPFLERCDFILMLEIRTNVLIIIYLRLKKNTGSLLEAT